jgi:AcrR family transcriptional regulator
MINNPPDKRALILSTALEEIGTYGIRGFTVDRLAKELGMSKKTIYGEFPTRDDLLRACFSQIRDRIQSHFNVILGRKDQSPVQKFAYIIRSVREIVGELNVSAINDLKQTYPDEWKRFEAFRANILTIFYNLLKSGQEQGLVRKDINIQIAAILHINIINRLFQPEFFLSNNITFIDTIEVYLSILTGGLLTPKGQQEMETFHPFDGA